MLAWIKANWGLILIVIGAVCTVLNAATTIWRDHPTAVKWLSFIISALSVVRSKGEPDGPLGALKLPGVPEQIGPRTPFVGVVLFATLAASTLLGCSLTPRAGLAKAHVLVTVADKAVLPILGEKCMAEAVKCGPVTEAKCPAYASCKAARAKYVTAATAVDAQLALINRLLADLGVK